MILIQELPSFVNTLFSIFFKNQSIYDSLNFSLSIRHPHSCLPHKFTPNHPLLTNPDSFPSVLPTSHYTHADPPPPSGSRPLSTLHAHADPPPGGSRRFTPVPTVRPRAASYLRCSSGHEAARSRPRSSVFTSTPSESRSSTYRLFEKFFCEISLESDRVNIQPQPPLLPPSYFVNIIPKFTSSHFQSFSTLCFFEENMNPVIIHHKSPRLAVHTWMATVSALPASASSTAAAPL